MRPEDRLGQLLDGRLELTSILGVGAYGVVYVAVDVYSCTPYAVKALSKLGLDERQRRFQAREIDLHARVQAHPNVVSLIEILDAPDTVFVVMEFCREGDLFARITECGSYVGADMLACRVFLQLLDAVEYCHSLGIYHRDLKPENILVCDGGLSVKLADFGLATTDAWTSDFGCGSTFYMSPECHTPSTSATAPSYASLPNDVWSLGVILVNLTCGRNPWKRASLEDETYFAYLNDPSFLCTILPLTYEFNTVLSRIFDPNPRTRISLADLRACVVALAHFTVAPSPVVKEEGFEAAYIPSTPQHIRRPLTPPSSAESSSMYVTPRGKKRSLHRQPGFQNYRGNCPPTPQSPCPKWRTYSSEEDEEEPELFQLPRRVPVF